MKLFLSWICAVLCLSAEIVPGRYIVELSSEPALLGRREVVLRHQQSLRVVLAARKIHVRASVDTVANAIFVDAPDAQSLDSLPGVRRVHPVKVLYKAADHALALMKIPEAWQSLGGPANAGKGIKIAIVDTGIDPYHQAFQDPSLTVPEGFPKFSSDANRPLTNNKIIVARSYDDSSALDQEGHGTAVAMLAAGVRHSGPSGFQLSGVAPKAFLGAYRANDGASGQFTTETILRAIDDAIKDGMDVINMSLGAPGLSRSEDEIITVAINRAVDSGVLVITAAGNSGPDSMTVGDTGAALNSISVGSSQSDRAPSAPAVLIPPLSLVFDGLPASNSNEAGPQSGALFDLSALDTTGTGCNRLPQGAIAGKIVLLQRGDCSFEDKLINSEAAGAVAAVVFNNQDDPPRIVMEAGSARLKALFLSRADGMALRQRLATSPALEVLLSFRFFLPDNPDRLSGYSSRGPTLDLAIKPDLVAVGANIITAASGTLPNRPESSGYVTASGTSLSAPLVAGAAAVLKAARPGLSMEQYRSLLVNSSTRFPAAQSIQVQQSGAGMLNLPGALSNTVALAPVSLSFGEYKGQGMTREFTLTNLGNQTQSFSFTILSPDSLKPQLPLASLTVGPGASSKLELQLSLPNAPPGEYQGYVEISGAAGTVSRLPYWAGVRAKEHSRISLTSAPNQAPAGRVVQILFRAVDAAGFYFDPAVEMAPLSGGGEVQNLVKLGADYPGLYFALVRLGPQAVANVFRITAGPVQREIRVQGER